VVCSREYRVDRLISMVEYYASLWLGQSRTSGLPCYNFLHVVAEQRVSKQHSKSIIEDHLWQCIVLLYEGAVQVGYLDPVVGLTSTGALSPCKNPEGKAMVETKCAVSGLCQHSRTHVIARTVSLSFRIALGAISLLSGRGRM
jgi:hypothetical protein